jgi:multidrug resistance protein, MATE family
MSTKPSLKVDTSIKGILLLSLPIGMAKLIPEINYLFNAIFLGQLGTLELALAGVTGVYYLIFAAVGYGLNNGLLALLSRRAGEENRKEIGDTLIHGIYLAWALAAISCIITWFGLDAILVFSGMDEKAALMASSFLKIRIFGLFFLLTMQMQYAWLISLQLSKYLIISALTLAISNVFFDYTLIFGHLGFPEFGFTGAAYGSVMAEMVGMLTIFVLIYFKKISKKYDIQFVWRFSIKRIRQVFRISFPLMAQYGASTLAWWIFFVLVSRNYPVTEQAVTQSMRNLFGLSGVFSWSFGSATNTMVSNLIGQNRIPDLKSVILKIIAISTIGMLILVLILNVFPEIFLNLYGQDVGFAEVGRGTLQVVSIAMIILCVGVVCLNSLVATGKTEQVLYIELVGILSYLLYIYIVIERHQMHINFAWMSEWVYWTILSVLSMIFFRRWYLKQFRQGAPI